MTSTRTGAEVREALTGGLAAAIADKGYAATTIADIVMHARVSKRTFYEHFADKEACLMALYEQGCVYLLAVVRSAADQRQQRRLEGDGQPRGDRLPQRSGGHAGGDPHAAGG